MKKVFLIAGIMAMVVFGSAAISPVLAQEVSKEVKDNPPKKDEMKKDKCADMKPEDCVKPGPKTGCCSKGMKPAATPAKAGNKEATEVKDKKSGGEKK